MDTLKAPPPATGPAGEATRARYPDEQGYVERAGNRLFYELYGEGDQTLFLLPTWTLIHSRFWKAQIPYFARHMRVLTFDGLGNGKSDRPKDPRAYDFGAFAEDALAVMDATGTERAHLVCLSRGAQWTLKLAADHPERVESAVFIGGFLPLSRRTRALYKSARAGMGSKIGAALAPLHPLGRMHPTKIAADYRGFVEWWIERCSPEPHSTRQIELAVEWGLDTDPETLITTLRGEVMMEPDRIYELCDRVRCPVLVINGDRDIVTPTRDAKLLAKRTRGRLVRFGRLGHGVGRWPVEINLAIRDFVGLEPPPTGPHRAPLERPAARPLHLLAHRARPRAPGRGDRPGTAQAPSRSAGRLACAGSGDPGAGGGRGAHPSGQRAPRERMRAHRVGVRRARPALLPRLPAHGRDLRGQLHALQRSGRARAVRPVDLRRGLGGRPLPAREPEPEDGALRLADRLHGFPADGPRRRARGPSDRGLQRRADQPRRGPARDPRPLDLRGQSRGHRGRPLRARPAAHPRLDRAALRLLGLRHGLRAGGATARRCGPSSATARTSACASSRWEGRAWARLCCEESWRPIPRPSVRCRSCA